MKALERASKSAMEARAAWRKLALLQNNELCGCSNTLGSSVPLKRAAVEQLGNTCRKGLQPNWSVI